jgi:hypothetical protein
MWHGDILHEVNMEGLVTCLRGKPIWRKSIKVIKRRALISRWHGITWVFTWRLVLDSRTLGLRIIHGGVVDLEEHMD